LKKASVLQLSSTGIVALCAVTASAQLRQPGLPAADRYSLVAEIPSLDLPTPDVDMLRAEDQQRDDSLMRYGAPLATAIDSDSFGVWEISADGNFDVWRVALVSKGAYSLGLTFSRFDLDPGATVFLYDADRKIVLGAYTEVNEQPNGMLGIQPFPGDTVIVEYAAPAGPGLRAKTIEIGEVVHDYRDVHGLLAQLAQDDGGDPIEAKGGCGPIPINCPEGANYQDIKRSVVNILVSGGAGIGSGAILNNTAQDFIPYLLTNATIGNLTNSVFAFGFEFVNCGGGPAPLDKTLSGAVKLGGGSDPYSSPLWRLNHQIPPHYEPYYAGWDRASSSGSPVVSIGHGGAIPKAIAIDADGAFSASTSGWRVNWTAGYLPGSDKGSPLFNAAKRVIGSGSFPNNFICGSQTVIFGKFSSVWTLENFGQWLDPIGGGAATHMDGVDSVGCGSSQKYGAGCAGTWGIVPTLDLKGCFGANGLFHLSIKSGLGGAPALLFFGRTQAALPMGSGCFLNAAPLIPVIAGPLPLSSLFPGLGTFVLQTTMPATLTPGTFTMQAFILDAGAPAGFSNTNGVRVTISP
jgi:hypothetical protein